MLRTLWLFSQATTLLIREEIHVSIMEVFNYFVLEHCNILKILKSTAHHEHVVSSASLHLHREMSITSKERYKLLEKIFVIKL